MSDFRVMEDLYGRLQDRDSRIAQLEVQNAALVEALEMVVLYHSGSPWDAAKAKRWERWSGSDDATTRNMCDQLRTVLFHAAEAAAAFTERIRAEEREACAKVLDEAAADARERAENWKRGGRFDMFDMKLFEASALEERATAIRARGKS